MLNERSQTQKPAHFMSPFIPHSGKDKTIGTEKSSVVAKD